MILYKSDMTVYFVSALVSEIFTFNSLESKGKSAKKALPF